MSPSNSIHMPSSVTRRMDVGIIAKLKQLSTLELAIYLEELKAGGPPVSLAPPVGSKTQREDQGDVDKDWGHLYDWVTMLYEEGYKPSPVLTEGMEDAISIVSTIERWPFSWILHFQNMKDLLLQNEKLMQAQEEKAQFLAAICTSLLAAAGKAFLSGLQEFWIWMLPSSLRQPSVHQRSLEPPLEE